MLRIATVIAALAFGCSAGGSERPLVVATVWPLAWLAEQVAPGAEVRLVPGAAGADPHDAELTPSEVLAVRDADAILYVGDVGYQPSVERAIAGARGDAIAMLDDPDEDPHLWHRPTALVALIGPLVAALPDRDVLDLDRIVELPDELGELQDAAGDLLSACPHDTVVVSHAGYAPLLRPLSIEQHGLSGSGAHVDPTAERLSRLAELIEDRGLPAVLTEPDEGREAAATLARRTGVELIDIEPLGTVTARQSERGYFALFRENVLAFARALGCEP